ncbi:MAG: Mobile element protein, partial [Olavius algarvensis Gamma 1 endosymbiont]
DGVSDALASGLRQLRDLRPLRHFGQPLAPTPTRGLPASRFALPWRAAVAELLQIDPNTVRNHFK